MKKLIKNISRLVTMEPGPGREGGLGVIKFASVLVEDGQIVWIGPETDQPPQVGGTEVIDARGMVAMPGIVDCHTHVVHAGFRQGEFNLRSQGKTYQEIAADGGGIMSTVRATRGASAAELAKSAMGRIGEALSHGITALEIKTGYGLDYDAEMRMVQAIDDISRATPVRVFGTFLGAHVVPAEYREKREEYVELVCGRMMRDAAEFEVITACDVFVEEGAYASEEAVRIANAAKALGLGIHLHVDQFTDVDGGKLAAELGALSADHLDRTSDAGMGAMAKARVVGVLLPGASFFAGRGHYPDARRMIDRGMTVAIATDYNPGSNPSLDPWMMATIAATQMGMSCDEALMVITKHAARALGRDDIGMIGEGARADMVLLDAPDEYFPVYRYGKSFVKAVIIDGDVRWGKV